MTTTIYWGSGFGRTRIGELGDDGRVYRGDAGEYDVAGEVAGGRVFRGDRSNYDVAGEIGDDGRVFRGDRSNYDVAGQVDRDGRVYRGDRQAADLIGEVEGPMQTEAAAALLLLLDHAS